MKIHSLKIENKRTLNFLPILSEIFISKFDQDYISEIINLILRI